MFLLSWFAETTLMAGALALLATLASRKPRFGPAARHAFWLVALARLLTPPLLAWPAIPEVWPGPAAAPRDATHLSSEPGTLLLDSSPQPSPSGSLSTSDLSALADAAQIRELETLEIKPALKRGSSIRWAVADAIPWVCCLWLTGSLAWCGTQIARVVVFSRRLRRTAPAPSWLTQELDTIAARLGVRAPPLELSSRCESPLLWCSYRVRLIVPAALLGRLGEDRWRAILAHELAHLRRGDPWTGRLVLAAGLVWWWNPLYWWIRRQLENEAELACDAWVVALLPDHRRTYAETLIDVCESFSRFRVAAPALGVGGRPGAFLERRLTMILKDRVSCRVPASGLAALACLAILAAPSWTKAQAPAEPSTVAAQDAERLRKLEQEAKAKIAAIDQDLQSLVASVKLPQAASAQEPADKEIEERRAQAEKQVAEAEERLREAQVRLKTEIATKTEQLQRARAELGRILADRKKIAAKVEFLTKVDETQQSQDSRAKAEQARAHAAHQRAIELLAKNQADLKADVILTHPEMHAAELANYYQALARAAASKGSAGSDSSSNIERRVANLEVKFDAILKELQALRGELKAPPQAK